ncbi:MAG: YfcE family phosphodiesterase [Candidatus Delongbacteria bacterium]|nr:YfcE family phosphodiesterase [Candidatus Delongbacteria bacterium]MCG2760752.1 YfcE family phosphodiesterase [Candidatus Delongbacteria bacterium]
MKILIMSDTHFRHSYYFGKIVLEHLSNSDMIIHCGDFTSLEFYNFLNSSKKLVAVKGNNDRQLEEILSMEAKIELFGFKIAVTHGHLIQNSNLHLKYPDSDIIITGHEHYPSIENFNKKLIISPGSLTDNRRLEYNSFMVMNLFEGQKPVVNIMKTK